MHSLTRARAAAIFVAVVSTLSACSVAPADDGDQASSQSAAITLPVPVPPIHFPAKSPCPSAAPAAGSECADVSLLCSWGDDPRFGCRTVESCDGTTWKSVGDSCTKEEPACPAADPVVDGGTNSCTSAELGLTCVYAGEAYTCTPCEGNLCFAANRWWTTTLSTGCPATVPNFGEACSVAAGTECNYDTCANDGADDFGAAMTCTKGFWTAYEGTICL